jgi:hypothetical protein
MTDSPQLYFDVPHFLCVFITKKVAESTSKEEKKTGKESLSPRSRAAGNSSCTTLL